MTVPTRIIEEDEYNKLIEQERGDTIIKFYLEDIAFNPPIPGEEWTPHTPKRVSVLLLNVIEPFLYKSQDTGETFVILNGYGGEEWFGYEAFQDAHLVKGAWGYRLFPQGWDADDWSDDMDDAYWAFAPDEDSA